MDEKYSGKSITTQRSGSKAKSAKDLDWILRVPDRDTVWIIKSGTEEIVRLNFAGAVLDGMEAQPNAADTDENLSKALTYMGAQELDYLVGPPDCTAEEAEAIASWVKSLRAMACVKHKVVLPHYTADSCAVVNFEAEDMEAGGVVYTTQEYCSRMAGLLAGTPMKISATYAPLPELTNVKRLTREEQNEAVGVGKLILVWDGRKVKSLIEKKTELQKKLQEVNEEVKEARKQFKELGNEASSDAYEKAQEKQAGLLSATDKEKLDGITFATDQEVNAMLDKVFGSEAAE